MDCYGNILKTRRYSGAAPPFPLHRSDRAGACVACPRHQHPLLLTVCAADFAATPWVIPWLRDVSDRRRLAPAHSTMCACRSECAGRDRSARARSMGLAQPVSELRAGEFLAEHAHGTGFEPPFAVVGDRARRCPATAASTECSQPRCSAGGFHRCRLFLFRSYLGTCSADRFSIMPLGRTPQPRLEQSSVGVHAAKVSCVYGPRIAAEATPAARRHR